MLRKILDMFVMKPLQIILNFLVKKVYPDRDYSVEKIEDHLFIHANDTTGCNTYLLKGQYSYDEVVALNELTKYHCGFGFCKELGPVAFIGVCNPHFCTTSGYFKYNVHEYGTLKDDSKYYFCVYSDEEAKNAGNYTVYGFRGVEQVSIKAPIEKMQYNYDSRYKEKEDCGRHKKNVVKVDLKLSGTYSFYEARQLATGTKQDKHWFSGDEHPIQFAVLEDGRYVGIINLWNSEGYIKFRDVWEYGKEEPKEEAIRFLSKAEAEKIKNFSLYVYIYPYSLKTKRYPIEKQDRTFDPRFNFYLPDGTDYRLK